MSPTPTQLSDRCFRDLVSLVYSLTGVTLDETKRSLMSNRIRRRLRSLEMETPESYIRMLRDLDQSTDEVIRFVEAVTTHKTSFFRTPGVWRFLAEEVQGLPKGASTYQAWSGASSTGEEPFSLALLLATIRGRSDGSTPWSIRATDVSPKTVEIAARGEFDADALRGAAQGQSWAAVEDGFDISGGNARAKTHLRSGIRFGVHNLLHAPSGNFDLILVRNVTIYFSEADKRRVIEHLLGALRPGGLLVIGESESLLARETELSFEHPCVYRKRT